ncbi:mechanosensitive ion channel family protein [Schumannella sp. 10F1B-5-1]|uniref:mechanosensitive ion channel family protein n=1 Tax=Schumannella sp. 10F1B-5-1 TaxID=2590780 RepID=UPI00112FF6CD|nr:mechanosensitive ion channel domain-containing protein [Schumannella sp. 10F1B-5-1]TPW76913.1 mechanosensitive ion channel [Schumannella sp. 10F1B-5-1]
MPDTISPLAASAPSALESLVASAASAPAAAPLAAAIPVPGWWAFAIAVVVAIVLAVIVTLVLTVPVRLLARRRRWEPTALRGIRRPFRILLLVITLWIAVQVAFPLRDVVATIEHGMLILAIATTAWLIGGIVGAALGGILARYPTDVADNRLARRIQTQVLLLRRIVVVVLVIVAAGAILLTFPGVEAVGTSLLASAGLVSVVAGLAAQSTLANLFAGVQLAFSDAIRVDDVVVVETQWGRIEDITLSYVVVHLWDDRRLVLPSTYFTTTPFENWTRHSSELLGGVEFDVDWSISPTAMRKELDAILDRTELWDERTKVLQVTDATGGVVRVRVLVSARDAGELFDLRCYVREQLVEWVRHSDTAGLPRQRVEMIDHAPARRREVGTDTGGLFTGSEDSERRALSFTQAIPLPDPADVEADAAERR